MSAGDIIIGGTRYMPRSFSRWLLLSQAVKGAASSKKFNCAQSNDPSIWK